MKVAIIYDRANKFGGAERVLIVLSELFPNADLYTSVYDRKAIWVQNYKQVYTSFLQKIPFAKKNHEFFCWLMPIAFEQFDFSSYDLVFSLTSEFAKGIITGTKTKHICYLLTPTRYLWTGENIYFENKIFKKLLAPVLSYLKKYDLLSANRPDEIISVSIEVKKRIEKFYNLSSKVIYPPVSINIQSDFTPKENNYYLIVSRLVSYKKIDIAINAFNKLEKKLIIIGSGREERKLKKLANKNIIFKKDISDNHLIGYYKNAVAFVMPQEEDFGIAAVEAQTFGVPLIAYKKGGVLDIVKSSQYGVLFNEQTVEDLYNAVLIFEKKQFNKKIIVKNGQRFSKEIFKKTISKII